MAMARRAPSALLVLNLVLAISDSRHLLAITRRRGVLKESANRARHLPKAVKGESRAALLRWDLKRRESVGARKAPRELRPRALQQLKGPGAAIRREETGLPAEPHRVEACLLHAEIYPRAEVNRPATCLLSAETRRRCVEPTPAGRETSLYARESLVGTGLVGLCAEPTLTRKDPPLHVKENLVGTSLVEPNLTLKDLPLHARESLVGTSLGLYAEPILEVTAAVTRAISLHARGNLETSLSVLGRARRDSLMSCPDPVVTVKLAPKRPTVVSVAARLVLEEDGMYKLINLRRQSRTSQSY